MASSLVQSVSTTLNDYMNLAAAAATTFTDDGRLLRSPNSGSGCGGLFSLDRPLARLAASMLQVSSVQMFGLETLLRSDAERRELDACAAERGASIADDDRSMPKEIHDTIIVRFTRPVAMEKACSSRCCTESSVSCSSFAALFKAFPIWFGRLTEVCLRTCAK